MVNIKSYRDLETWQSAMDPVERCYRMTDRFPKSEQFGLAVQIRRAAVSIPSNIAEGHNRPSTLAFLNHLGIALGSQAELETQLELSARLGFAERIDVEAVMELAGQVGRQLRGLRRALEASPEGHPPAPSSQSPAPKSNR